MENKRTFTFLILGIALFVGCSKQDKTPSVSDSAKVSALPVKVGKGKGIVRGIDIPMKTVTIDHSDVPNVMEAMTMDYKVAQPEELQGVKVGDSITFTLEDLGEGNFVVTAINPFTKH